MHEDISGGKNTLHNLYCSVERQFLDIPKVGLISISKYVGKIVCNNTCVNVIYFPL